MSATVVSRAGERGFAWRVRLPKDVGAGEVQGDERKEKEIKEREKKERGREAEPVSDRVSRGVRSEEDVLNIR